MPIISGALLCRLTPLWLVWCVVYCQSDHPGNSHEGTAIVSVILPSRLTNPLSRAGMTHPDPRSPVELSDAVKVDTTVSVGRRVLGQGRCTHWAWSGRD